MPVALVQQFFGFSDGDPGKLIEWSYWNQQDAFHNQPFDADRVSDPDRIIAERKAANIRLALYVGRLVAKRSVKVKLGGDENDPVSRLLRLSFSGGLRFPLKKVLFNVGGLLIGAVETTSHAVNHALAELLGRPELLDQARSAAAKSDPSEFDGYVFEALRFRPAFPYFFRTCHRATELAGGTPFATEIRPGTTVIACTHSAMFDECRLRRSRRLQPEAHGGRDLHLRLWRARMPGPHHRHRDGPGDRAPVPAPARPAGKVGDRISRRGAGIVPASVEPLILSR